MDDILKAILENATRGQQQQQGYGRQQTPRGGAAAADPMEALIKGILGGGQPQQQQRRQQPAQPQGGMGLDDILGAVLGGSQRAGTQQAGGISDLINAVLGGGRAAQGMGGGGGLGGMAINPIANILAQRLGIPPAIARAVVAFFLSKFVGNMFNKKQQQQQRRQPEYAPQQEEYGYRNEPETLDLDDILDDMDDDYALQSHFANNGMAEELAQMTGMDYKMANQALSEMAKLVGQERRTVKPVRPSNNELKDLLDTW